MQKENVCFWQHYSAEEQADAIQGFVDAIHEMPANAVKEQLTAERMERVALTLKQSAEMLDKIVLIQKFAAFYSEYYAQKKPC